MGRRNCGIRRSRGEKSEVKVEVKVKVKVEEKNSTTIWNLFREKNEIN
jgi:hypothetical protein